MNPTLIMVTLRQLLTRRRMALLLLLGGVLILVAVVYQLASPSGSAPRFAAGLLDNFAVRALLPIVALLLGTGAIGSEIDDGTVVYILTKPIPRRTIVLTKLFVASAVAAPLTAVPTFVGGLIAAGSPADGMVVAFTLAVIIGTVLYCAVFLALSLVTSRALIFGLIYVLVWEGLLAGLFAGTRILSIREVTLALADALTDASTVTAQLDLLTALFVTAIVLAASVLLAINRLSAFEIRGETA